MLVRLPLSRLSPVLSVFTRHSTLFFTCDAPRLHTVVLRFRFEIRFSWLFFRWVFLSFLFPWVCLACLMFYFYYIRCLPGWKQPRRARNVCRKIGTFPLCSVVGDDTFWREVLFSSSPCSFWTVILYGLFLPFGTPLLCGISTVDLEVYRYISINGMNFVRCYWLIADTFYCWICCKK